ncbi:MAG: HIT domain-containing protein [Gammaproteobacteria bacterium]|nr:HIT domain-containing protein [Gammaproteobacteria bacterium]NIO62841.1 HIT domain-containing protein [Gammaproteobacteria bacterium]NIT40916.1 HIT domain-containing protein [Gammaproteobacteria bacterium]
MTIHHQLINDCHQLGRMNSGTLLLHKNASVPWFILVPDTDKTELLYLPANQRDQIMQDCSSIAVFIKQQFGSEKINFAAIGNLVPQLHLHVIGRNKNDPCWPKPVWGHLHADDSYREETIQRITESLFGAVKADISRDR